MSAHLLKRTGTGTVAATAQHRSAFFNPDTLAWLPWVMPGTFFKLLNINTMSGGFSMLLKVEPDNWAPVHGHLGSVEGWMLEGGFGYGEDRGRTGHYVFESGGIRHEPDTDKDGMVMFAVAHGPLCGYNDDGSIAGIVDARVMYDMAVAGGGADHIPKPLDW